MKLNKVTVGLQQKIGQPNFGSSPVLAASSKSTWTTTKQAIPTPSASESGKRSRGAGPASKSNCNVRPHPR